MKTFPFLSQCGLSMLEVLIGAGALGALALGGASLMENQTKNANSFEIMAKKEQLRLSLLSQVLNDPEQCGCMFGPVTFPDAGTSEISSSVTSLGRYNFSTPGDCSSASMPLPLITTDGVDQMKLESVKLHNIRPVSGMYLGELRVDLSNMKKSSGTKIKHLNIPIIVGTVPDSPGTVRMDGCSAAEASTSPITFMRVVRNPTFPIVIDVPPGMKKLIVSVTASQYIGLPSDKGRTAGSRYTYTTDLSSVPVTFSEFEVGAGNNNGAQARISGSTEGVIDITTESQVTIDRSSYLLNESGSSLCTSGTCGINYSAKLLRVFGSND